jgi:cystathionine beta-lyase
MHVAEMDFQIADSIRNVIVEMAQSSDLGYLGPVPEVAEAFAGFAKRRWNWTVDTAQVKMATDVGVAAVEIFRTLGAPGDKVIVNPPVYGSFYHWIEEAKLEQVDVPLIRTDRTYCHTRRKIRRYCGQRRDSRAANLCRRNLCALSKRR